MCYLSRGAFSVTYFIGDKDSDEKAAKRFGLKYIHVLTGHGQIHADKVRPHHTAKNLKDAVDWLL